MTITIAWWVGPVVLALLPFFYPEEGPMDFGAMFVQAFADRHQGGLQPDMFAAPAARKPRQSTRSGPGPTAGEATDD